MKREIRAAFAPDRVRFGAAAIVAALVVALVASAAGVARILPTLLDPDVPARAICGFEFHKRDRKPGSAELADAWRPYIETCIEAFGPRRAMFESNFPVDKVSCSYEALWNAFKRIAGGASAEDKGWLFKDSARAFYRLAD